MNELISGKSPDENLAQVQNGPQRHEVEALSSKPKVKMTEFGERSAKRPDNLPAKEVPPQLVAYKPGKSGSPATQWKPGQSGNPSGLALRKTPVSTATKEFLAQPYRGPRKEFRVRHYTNAQAMVAKQLEMAIDEGDMRAAEELANRAEGKVVSVQQLQGPGGGPIELSAMSPEEKQARLAELLQKALTE